MTKFFRFFFSFVNKVPRFYTKKKLYLLQSCHKFPMQIFYKNVMVYWYYRLELRLKCQQNFCVKLNCNEKNKIYFFCLIKRNIFTCVSYWYFSFSVLFLFGFFVFFFTLFACESFINFLMNHTVKVKSSDNIPVCFRIWIMLL